jgi:hypothetical protein
MSHEAMLVGRNDAVYYDLVTAGQTDISMSDARSLRDSTSAHVTFRMIHADAMLEATILVIHMMLGSDHPLVKITVSFVTRYNAD